jgi:type I restriction enzyme S subunit
LGNDWQSATVEEVAVKVGMGPFGSSIKVETFVDEGIPIISGQHLTDVRLIDIENNFISYEHAERLKNANVYKGDVIFTHAGNIGQVAYIPDTSKYERYIISQRQFYMRCNQERILPEFITYFFNSPEGQHKLLANASSSGVPSIAQPVSYLKTIRVPVPPLFEQRAIAHILGILGDKIELNRKMNQTLEALAQAIFKSWFVDFEPFRDQGMQGSPLGEIPTEWSVGKMKQALELKYGKGLKRERRIPGGVPVYGSNGQVGWHNESLSKGPGIIVGRKGNPGTVTWVPVDFFPIDTTFYVEPRTMVKSMVYLFYALCFLDLPSLDADSAVPGLNRNMAYMSDILIPPEAVLIEFDKHVNLLMDMIFVLDKESQTLSNIRDALLSKLLSGEMRIKNVEKFAEEVL